MENNQKNPANVKKIGLITSGGDSPGMNAAIRSVVRSAIYYNIEVIGFMRGYNGLIENDYIEMDRRSVSNIIQHGGTILKTARSQAFTTVEGRKKAADNLRALGIDGLVAIGGNGTFTGGMVFHKEHGIPTVGISGTIDNDLYGTDFTLGFDTAVNTAVEAIDKIRDTADSHNRLFVVEVMGRDSGYIAADVGLSCGAESILVPESEKDIEYLLKLLKKNSKSGKRSNIIVVAEGEETGGGYQIGDMIKGYHPEYDVRVTVLGHIQRGGSPTAIDRILGSRLGHAAVVGLMEGQSNVMAGIVNNKIVYTDFKTAITKKKKINEDNLLLSEILSS